MLGRSRMWPAKQLDIGWSDLAAAAAYGLTRGSPADEAQTLERSWGGDLGMACLSVRSGFDLLLAALELPAGSEVLMTAVTISDMVRIVEHHGLVAVPLDLELSTLAPRLEAIEAAITPRTRAIVVAHLFGSRVPMKPIVEIARRRGLLVIEDLAQGYAGPHDLGDAESDAALFSFGTIKTATALGGALLRIRDPALLHRMRAIQSGYPVQSRAACLSRAAKYGLLKGATTWTGYTALVALLRAAGCDHDRLAAKLVRGFPAANLFDQLRQQPSAPLLALLARRLKRFVAGRLRRRAERGRDLAARLDGIYAVPGSVAAVHSHWIFPVLASDPPRLINRLSRAGFHATQGRSMCAITAPADRPNLQPTSAERLLSEGVFLPIYPELPEAEFQRLAGVLLEFARRPAYWTAPLVTARNTSSSDCSRLPNSAMAKPARTISRSIATSTDSSPS
jgi:perosamine synthetase